MKNFLLKLFWFIFPMLIIAYPLDVFISHNLKKSNDDFGEFEIWNDIYDGKANCDIAIYGSSRASVHINPKILEDSLHKVVYNFGHAGQSFWMQYYEHTELLKHHIKPKLIIVSLDTFTLTGRSSLWESKQFLPYLLFNNDLRKYVSNYSNFNKLDFYLPLVRYFGKKESLSKAGHNFFTQQGNIYPIRNQGFTPINREWNEESDLKVNKRENFKEYFDKPTVDLFEQFIKECQDSEIKLILVYSPEYFQILKYITNLNEIMAFYQSISMKYNLPFLDYSNDEMSYDKDLFCDSLHLNSKGANIFTLKLTSDIQKLR